MFSAKASKAFVAAVLAAISAATLAASDGFTSTELLTIVGALVVTFQAAYWTPNAKEVAGTIDVAQTPDGKKTFSLNLDSDPEELETKSEVTFKIVK
jgi:hypothetical protein